MALWKIALIILGGVVFPFVLISLALIPAWVDRKMNYFQRLSQIGWREMADGRLERVPAGGVSPGTSFRGYDLMDMILDSSPVRLSWESTGMGLIGFAIKAQLFFAIRSHMRRQRRLYSPVQMEALERVADAPSLEEGRKILEEHFS